MQDALSRYFRSMAYNNAWANYRLLGACATLDPTQFEAPRVSFFPTLRATLNHILTVDWFYVDALERELRGQQPNPDSRAYFDRPEPFASCAELQREQAAVDQRLLEYCRQMRDAALERPVTILRRNGPQSDTRARLLAHLFQHQIHHRGQVHAMLSGTTATPPQLDDFFCAGDAPLRAGDLRALGWSEAEIWN